MDKTNYSVARVKTYTKIRKLVLESLQRVISYVQCFEDLFIKEQLEQSSESQKQELVNKQRILSKAQKRVKEIDIYYNGVGIISVPVDEFEMEKAFQEKIKKKTA